MVTIEERAKAKHINAVAKDFMCAMMANYYFSETITNEAAIDRCFKMAKKFVEKEIHP